MYKHKLQVWGEDLAVADISQTSVDGEAVNGGGTNGGLVVNVIAESAVKVAGSVTVRRAGYLPKGRYTVREWAKDGDFSTTETSANLTVGDYAAGDLIAQIALAPDVKTWLKGKVAGNSSASGTICVTLGYLAR